MNEPSEMPTPRTNAIAQWIKDELPAFTKSEARLLDFARQLERDLSTLRIAAEAARVALDAIMKECYSEANRLANHGSNGLEKLVMSHLYDIANETKPKLASLRSELAKTTPANPETPAPHPG